MLHNRDENTNIEFKIVVIGAVESGKTALITQLCKNVFLEKHKHKDFTSMRYIGKNTSLHLVEVDKIQLYGNTLSAAHLLNKSDAVILCYDPSLPSPLPDYAKQVKKYLPNKPIILVRTKADLIPEEEKAFNNKQLTERAKEIHAALHFTVSAKRTLEVTEMFEKIADDLFNAHKNKVSLAQEIANKQMTLMYSSNLDKVKTTPDPIGAVTFLKDHPAPIIQIYNALYENELSVFHKKNAWSDKKIAKYNTSELRHQIEEKADYSRTAAALKLHKENPDWNNTLSKDHETHFVKLYNGIRDYAYAHSNLFKKKPKEARSKGEILERAKKSKSNTAKTLEALKPKPLKF